MLDIYVDVIHEKIDIDKEVIKFCLQELLNKGYSPVDAGCEIISYYNKIKAEE